ncbi:hypothetical protein HMPREF9081_1894 [Centipeda periodontii DSM 2778]|uniref:Uncharacterized protein n=1 Tax=Centipeda periodontii DSM 2778 TaxID=888060 RepID=F5RNS3_9FIRM|nr:hypothetical protein HMPREF9081_1894 [Centipeda periodontii DSM 2778]
MFQSTRPVRGATTDTATSPSEFSFQSTRPVRGATPLYISIETVPPFQSTRPVRGATAAVLISIGGKLFQSTRPVRGATEDYHDFCGSQTVSIHAPRAGRDATRAELFFLTSRFNPRAPCGARPRDEDILRAIGMFQSTRPVRGATSLVSDLVLRRVFQSTRPVRGATPPLARVFCV